MIRRNKVTMRGKVISNHLDPETSRRILILFIKEGDRETRVRFICEDPEVANAARHFQRNSHVEVEGFVRSFRFYNRTFDKYTSISYFIATRVAEDKSLIELSFGDDFGDVKSKFYRKPMFRAEISGTVYTVVDTGNPSWGKLIVRTAGGGIDKRDSIVVLSYFRDPSRSRLPKLDYIRGDEVILLATVSTPRKVINGQNQTFENLIVEDIVCTKRMPRENETKVGTTDAVEKDIASDFDDTDETEARTDVSSAAVENMSADSEASANASNETSSEDSAANASDSTDDPMQNSSFSFGAMFGL